MIPSFRFLSVAALGLGLAAPALAQQQTPPRPAAQPTRPAATPARPAAQPRTPAAQPQRPAAQPARQPARPAAQPAAPAAASAAAPGPGGIAANLVATFGDWGVYTAQTARSKICYALTQPKDRLPKNLNRDPAYLFVSFRPAENVRNEVALVLGFPTRDNSPAEASIGNATYALLTKEQNAWLRNPAEEGQAIGAMSRGQSLVVKAQSQRGNQLTDRYSLTGFTQALERARRECA